MKSIGSLVAVVVVIFLLPLQSVQAFNTATHKAMNHGGGPGLRR
jgi:hypothetical protein